MSAFAKFPFHAVSRVASLTAILLGALDLAGWSFEVEFLKRVSPNLPTMNPMTAVEFIFSGMSLLLLHPETANTNARWLGRLCAMVMLAFVSIKLLELIFNLPSEIDQQLFPSKLASAAGERPSRMSPNTALNFCLIGVALLLLDRKWRDGWRPARLFLFIPLMLATLVLIGYAAGIEFFSVVGIFYPMALHTAFGFIALATGILCARIEIGQQMETSIGRRITTGFAVGISFLILAGVICYQSIYALIENSRLVAHTHETLAAIDDMRLSFLQMENRRHSYLLKPTESMASLFEESRNKTQRNFKQIRELTADNRDQQQTLNEFEPIMREALTTLSLSMKTAPGPSAGKTEPPASGQRRNWREQVFSHLATISRREETLLTQRQDAADRVRRQAVTVMVCGGLVAAFLAGIALWLVRRDLEARLQMEKQLKEGEAMFQGFFEFAPDAIIIVDEGGILLRANAQAERLFGYSRPELIGQPIEILIPERFRRQHAGHRMQYMSDQHRRPMGEGLDLFCRRKDGTEFPVDIMLSPFTAPKGNHVIAVVRDITERKQVEERLRASEAEFRSLAEAVPQIVWATRPDGWNIYFNQQWIDYTGMTLEESMGHGWNKPFHPDDQQRAWDAWQKAITTNGTYSLECRLRRKDGIYRWWLIRGEPLKDPNGKIVKWFGTCTDIHDLKIGKEAAAQSLQEKEVLLREIHHRVKNNMQVISSLLELQSRYLEEPVARKVFAESQIRIKSMSLIHEKLYQSPDLARIDFGEYMGSLVQMIARSYQTRAGQVRIDTQSDRIWLSVETGVPVGLIINELVSNSLKYAFPGERRGTISVVLRERNKRTFELCVRDNGVGLPSDFRFETARSLGLRLVKILADQIGGELEIGKGEGTQFKLSFRDAKP